MKMTYGPYLGRVSPQARLRSESFSADVAVERPVLRAFHLSVMIAQMLLEVAELDEGATTLRQVTLVGPLACKNRR
jgi:hypothetical protein